MTSKQVMLTLAVLMLCGCSVLPKPVADPLWAPYPERRVWAVAPLRNESSLYADGIRSADRLAAQLEEAANVDVMPVNRTIEAMNALQIGEVTTTAQAMAIMQTLKADALVIGTISAYNPYDPPKIGMAIELYVDPRFLHGEYSFDVRQLSRTPRGQATLPAMGQPGQPVSTVSAHLNSASPNVRKMVQRYAHERSGVDKDPIAWKRYLASMDLYCEFASYVMSWRLLDAEANRLTKLAQQDVEQSTR